MDVIFGQNKDVANLYELFKQIDPERNPVFTAADQIRGAKLAKVYLVNRMETLTGTATERLIIALGEIDNALGYSTIGNNPGSSHDEQHSKSMKPWRTAFEELREEVGLQERYLEALDQLVEDEVDRRTEGIDPSKLPEPGYAALREATRSEVLADVSWHLGSPAQSQPMTPAL